MPAKSPPPDRRRTPRVESQLLVKFRQLGDPSEKWHMAPLKDISSTGIRFTTDQAFPGDATLELQLLLPTSAAPLHLTGRVMWAHPSPLPPLTDYGVAYADFQPAQREEIERIVTLYRERKRRPARS